MNKNILVVCSVAMIVIGVIQGISYFTGNTLGMGQAFASFTFAYAINVQIQVDQLREKIAKLGL